MTEADQAFQTKLEHPRYGESHLFSPSESATHWTLTAGSLKPNQYGLFDMLGNLAEWCQERYCEFQPDGTTINFVEESRVIRGGSFRYQATMLRSAQRTWDIPGYRSPYVGFRIVRQSRP
ncbi:MAG: SUMF1/EgtB/PvdO family nonheme iron enzyme [Planctomycetaceae bacterium]|nr:SUMF1/EgtB/PvdO family nonheme iron enzyme [Planctomycetaceae bacterium]